MKKIWHWILNMIAWLTQDNKKLFDAKHKTSVDREIAIQRMRSRTGRF
jgi:hypothetical protein